VDFGELQRFFPSLLLTRVGSAPPLSFLILIGVLGVCYSRAAVPNALSQLPLAIDGKLRRLACVVVYQIGCLPPAHATQVAVSALLNLQIRARQAIYCHSGH
jgi:hypothetical protein